MHNFLVVNWMLILFFCCCCCCFQSMLERIVQCLMDCLSFASCQLVVLLVSETNLIWLVLPPSFYWLLSHHRFMLCCLWLFYILYLQREQLSWINNKQMLQSTGQVACTMQRNLKHQDFVMSMTLFWPFSSCWSKYFAFLWFPSVTLLLQTATVAIQSCSSRNAFSS